MDRYKEKSCTSNPASRIASMLFRTYGCDIRTSELLPRTLGIVVESLTSRCSSPRKSERAPNQTLIAAHRRPRISGASMAAMALSCCAMTCTTAHVQYLSSIESLDCGTVVTCCRVRFKKRTYCGAKAGRWCRASAGNKDADTQNICAMQTRNSSLLLILGVFRWPSPRVSGYCSSSCYKHIRTHWSPAH